MNVIFFCYKHFVLKKNESKPFCQNWVGTSNTDVFASVTFLPLALSVLITKDFLRAIISFTNGFAALFSGSDVLSERFYALNERDKSYLLADVRVKY